MSTDTVIPDSVSPQPNPNGIQLTKTQVSTGAIAILALGTWWPRILEVLQSLTSSQLLVAGAVFIAGALGGLLNSIVVSGGLSRFLKPAPGGQPWTVWALPNLLLGGTASVLNVCFGLANFQDLEQQLSSHGPTTWSATSEIFGPQLIRAMIIGFGISRVMASSGLNKMWTDAFSAALNQSEKSNAAKALQQNSVTPQFAQELVARTSDHESWDDLAGLLNGPQATNVLDKLMSPGAKLDGSEVALSNLSSAKGLTSDIQTALKSINLKDLPRFSDGIIQLLKAKTGRSADDLDKQSNQITALWIEAKKAVDALQTIQSKEIRNSTSGSPAKV